MSVQSAIRKEGYAFDIQSHSFLVRTDVKENLGGKNEAPDPHDYLTISLAACTAITLQMYAQRKQIPLESTDIKIDISAEGKENIIQRELRFVGDLSEEQKTALLGIADKCPIHKFLTSGCKILTKAI